MASSSSQSREPPWRESHFRSAFLTGKTLSLRARNFLQRCPGTLPDQHIREADKLANYETPTEMKIGLDGHSGEGKSSTLNSILDQAGLAKSEACGKAVTSFPVEYRRQTSTNQAAISIECKFQQPAERRSHLARLLQNYHALEIYGSPDDSEEYEEMVSNRKEALDVFDELFGRIDDFSEEGIALDPNYSMEPALERLTAWAEKLIFPPGVDEVGKWSQEAHSAEESQEHLSLLQTHGLWPTLESVRIYSRDAMLEGGLVLVDLPGSQDINIARVRTALREKKTCDFLILVVRIDRAVTNILIQQTLKAAQDLQKRTGGTKSRVAIVCTRSATIEEHERANMEKLVKADDKPALARAHQALKDLEKAEEDMSVREFRKAEKKAKQDLDAILIKARSNKVCSLLKQKYAAWFSPAELPVFCIDNSVYWDGELGPELSGVKPLRNYLQDLPQESLFKHQDTFLADKLPVFIDSFEHWVRSNRVNENLDRRPRLPEPDCLALCGRVVDTWRNEMLKTFEAVVDGGFEARTQAIQKGCLEVMNRISQWRHASIRSWVKNKGTHRTSTMGFECWNSDFMACIDREMAIPLHNFDVQTDGIIKEMQKRIEGTWEDYMEECCKIDPVSRIPIAVLQRSKIVKGTLESSMEEYLGRIARIKFDATSMHPACYLVDIMLEAYTDAAQEAGPGSKARKLGILENHIRSDQFLPALRARIVEDYAAAINKAHETMANVVQDEAAAVDADLALIQTRKGEERLFKTYPDYGHEAETLLCSLKEDLVQINKDAAAARATAKVMYG